MSTPNRNTRGGAFTPQEIQAVWDKGKVVPGMDPKIFRQDICSAWMKRDEYGNTNSDNGWEIDHITPVSRGGTDHISNLQPLQWNNNRAKGDDTTGKWECARVAKK